MSTALTEWTNSKIQSLGHTSLLVNNLQSQIQHNPSSGPCAFVCPKTMMEQYYALEIEEATLQDIPDAITPLVYYDGYPATPNGTPFWERLEGEPQEYYDLFKCYREDSYIKSLTKHSQPPTRFEQYNPSTKRNARTLTEVADKTGKNRDVLKVLALLYHWYLRAEAYDQFNRAQLEKLKSAEVQYMENVHQHAARTLFNKAMDYFDAHSEELDPKTALQLLQTATELERLSLGLPKDKPPGDGHEQHYDRRPWVQINQQYNSGQQHQSSNEDDESPEERTRTIVRVLREAGALEPEAEEHSPQAEGTCAEAEGEVLDGEYELETQRSDGT